MTSWTAVPRSLRFASAIAAVALLGACADSNTAASVAGPGPSGLEVRGVIASSPTPTQVLACVSGASGPFTITTSQVGVASASGGTTTIASSGTTSVGGDNCVLVATQTGNFGFGTFSVTITLAGGGILNSTTCTDQIKAPGTFDCTGESVQLTANGFHGSIVVFNVIHPTVVTGCTVTRGFILNQLDLITNTTGPKINVVINGVPLSKEEIRTALTTPTRGDSEVQLKAQLITALANISLGATSNATVDAAIAVARRAFDASTANDPSAAAISAAITTLTSFNEGTAGNGASAHCNDAEEAFLKDKAKQ